MAVMYGYGTYIGYVVIKIVQVEGRRFQAKKKKKKVCLSMCSVANKAP